MKVLMTGATGVVGNRVGLELSRLGHEIFVVSRSRKKAELALEFPAQIIEHDLVKESFSSKQDSTLLNNLNGIEAIVHLMGETVDGRWTQAKKENILDSRKKSSENLVQSLQFFSRLKVIVSASAQGIYGDRSDEVLTEKALTDEKSFLAQVCEFWEKPFRNLIVDQRKIRTVQLRIGLVLDPGSGVLKKMIPLFQKGLGGELSSGQQYMSWIALIDLRNIIVQSLLNDQYQGVINCSTPQPVKNKQWTSLLAESLGVFKSLPVPKLALKVALGEMANVVLASCRMHPEKLLELNFKFKHLELKSFFNEEIKNFSHGQSYFESRQYLNLSIDKAFDFFSKAQNLEKITPESVQFKVKNISTPLIQKGSLIEYDFKIHGLPLHWQTEITSWNPPFQFSDVQIKGPYHTWIHEHVFEKCGTGTLMTDKVIYKLPLGFSGRLVAGAFVQNDVEKIFNYRRQALSHINME